MAITPTTLMFDFLASNPITDFKSWCWPWRHEASWSIFEKYDFLCWMLSISAPKLRPWIVRPCGVSLQQLHGTACSTHRGTELDHAMALGDNTTDSQRLQYKADWHCGSYRKQLPDWDRASRRKRLYPQNQQDERQPGKLGTNLWLIAHNHKKVSAQWRRD